MHALFATPAYPPFPGGGERFVQSLARSLGERGVRVTVATTSAVREPDLWRNLRGSSRSIQSEIEGPLRIIRCPIQGMPGGFSGLLAWRKAMVLISALPGDQSRILRRMARRVPNIPAFQQALLSNQEGFDLVHAFNLSWEYPAVAAEQIASSRSIPLVLTPFVHTGVQGKDRVSRNTAMDHQISMLHRANSVHTLTDLERDHLTKFGVKPQQLLTVGAAMDPLPTLSKDALQWAGGVIDDPFVLFLGRTSYDKGAILAANAVLRARRDGAVVSLVLVGQLTREFKRYYIELPASEKPAIIAMGVLSEEKKHALLEQTRMLVLPSRTDSFGLVILEAWAHSKPVIGVKAGGLAEVIADGIDGFLVDFDDEVSLAEKIKLLLQQSQLGEAMARAGQQEIRDRFNWECVSQKVLTSYEQILS